MNIRVLIVDPDESLLETYCDFLSAHGFDLSTATSGPDCAAKLRAFAPDVLVLEPELPDDWGKRLLSMMREATEVPSVPVVVLTRRDQCTPVAPVQEFHTKPFSLSKLAACIRRLAGDRTSSPDPNHSRAE